MSPEEKSFLSLRTLPARLSPEQTAWYLNCPVESLRVLIAAGLLKPLGKPAPNSTKFFSLVELEQHRADPKWLSRLTDAITAWHRRKNGAGDASLRPIMRRPISRSQPAGQASQSARPWSVRSRCRTENRAAPAALPGPRPSSADQAHSAYDPAPRDEDSPA